VQETSDSNEGRFYLVSIGSSAEKAAASVLSHPRNLELIRKAEHRFRPSNAGDGPWFSYFDPGQRALNGWHSPRGLLVYGDNDAYKEFIRLISQGDQEANP
jgi:hypothetical protein